MDGILVDFTAEVFIPTARTVLDRHIPIPAVQPQWSYQNLITIEEESEVWSSPLLIAHIKTAAPLQHAVEMILASRDPLIITSRSMSGRKDHRPLIREATYLWMENVGINHIPICFARGSEKASVARDHGCVSIWEDKPETVLSCAESGLNVFMPVYGYNSHVEHDNVYRVGGWVK